MTCEKEHHKVYANFQLTSFPAQQPWICKICGAEGTDTVTLCAEFESYDQIKKRFKEAQHGSES
jgi:hypothetical protein